MATTSFVADDMHAIALQLFTPCSLLVNYTLLQYVMFFYWARRREPRVALLFLVGIVGVSCLVPFANPNGDLTDGLNDVSESCCSLVFLLQITILGRDLNKKIKFKTVLYLTWVAEALIVLDVVMIVFSLVLVVRPNSLGEQFAPLGDGLPNAFESINLVFVLFFRFFCVMKARGWRDVVTKRKREVLWYGLFATHEVPFLILKSVSGLPWESVQAIWNRVTLAGCLYITATAKLRDRASTNSHVDSTVTRLQPTANRSSVGRTKRMSGGSKTHVVASTCTGLTDLTSVKQDDEE